MMGIFKSIIKSRRNRGVPLAEIIILAIIATTLILTPGLAQEKPIILYVNGIEVISDVPLFVMNGRSYLPASFVNDILDTQFSWDPKTRTVIKMGAPQSGVGMIKDLPAFTGKELDNPVKIKRESYIKGYKLTGKNEVRWNLKRLFDKVTFGFGVPDAFGVRGSAGFTVMADGEKIAEETVSKEDGLQQFSFDVSGVSTLTVKYYKGEGGVIINPKLYQSEESESSSN